MEVKWGLVGGLHCFFSPGPGGGAFACFSLVYTLFVKVPQGWMWGITTGYVGMADKLLNVPWRWGIGAFW